MDILIHEITKSHLELAKELVNFFMAEFSDVDIFEKIRNFCLKNNDNNSAVCIGLGYFSTSDFKNYYLSSHFNSNSSVSSVSPRVVEYLIEKLLENHVIRSMPKSLSVSLSEQRFQYNGEFAKFLYERDLVFNVIFGWNFIINKYSYSVLKVEHTSQNGDISMGTGFYFAIRSASGNCKYAVITNKHVIENAKHIRILTKDDAELNYNNCIKTDAKMDLAFIELNDALSSPTFWLYPSVELLSEIITIGYPSVPQTKNSYQLCHKGEINAHVENYSGEKFFLFSAKTSSGNSGSPIIDRHGMVVGIVSQELFDPDQFTSKGKLPYAAGIPSSEIINSFNENFLEASL